MFFRMHWNTLAETNSYSISYERAEEKHALRSIKVSEKLASPVMAVDQF